MDLINNKSSIDIITGPMFSGKTTELVRRLTIFVEAGMSVLYINSTLDTRQFISHNKNISSLSMACATTDLLKNIIDIAKTYDVIGIDEAQFFDDLPEISIELAEKYSRKVIIAGLNSDFSREKFGKICDLIPICDNISKLYPFCNICAKKKILTPALFSKRTSDSRDKISIGAGDSYIPVCRICYNL
jgi:thymidine kinase